MEMLCVSNGGWLAGWRPLHWGGGGGLLAVAERDGLARGWRLEAGEKRSVDMYA